MSLTFLKTSLFFSLIALFACGAMQTGHSITGTIKGAENLQIVFEQFQFDGKHLPIGKSQADAQGTFTLKQEMPFEKAIYRLQMGQKQIFFMLGGDEKAVTFTADMNEPKYMNLTFEGSEVASCYVTKIKELASLAQQAFTPELAKEKIAGACNPLMGALMTSQIFGQQAPNFLPEFKMATEKLNVDMPGSKYASDFAFQVKNLETALAQQAAGGAQAAPAAPGGAIAIGSAAPAIRLSDPNGKIRSLDDVKGKVVLLDFWASWCGPCRRENPNVVRVYNTYKDKGFTVFSVSLDKENGKSAWIDAIKQDGLIWENHVSELKGWQGEVSQRYGVQGIPQTYLLDREGKIAAINPRANLEEAVKKALGK